MSKIAENGNEVEINYVGKLADGKEFDSTKGDETFKFTVGGGEVIEGMSSGIIGMKVGDKKTIEIEPESAYGARRDDLLAKVPVTNLPEGTNVGDGLSDADNPNQPWWVIEINKDYAILDGNHPLAGHKLIFDIEMVSIK